MSTLAPRASAADQPGVPDCPGLTRPHNSGPSFLDVFGRVYDLDREPMLTAEQAAADPRLGGLYTESGVLELVRTGQLYPIFRKNARVIRVFDCGLTDLRARLLRRADSPLRLTNLAAR